MTDAIDKLKLIHFLERDLNYPCDELLFWVTDAITDNDLKDVILNDDIDEDVIYRAFYRDFDDLNARRLMYQKSPGERPFYQTLNRQRLNKAILLYIITGKYNSLTVWRIVMNQVSKLPTEYDLAA